MSNGSPVAGTTFTLSATVSNAGAETSAATTLRYYWSTDATITTSDTQVGTDSVGALAVGAGSDQSIDLTAPSETGTYYYGACVDAVTDEATTNNNCSVAVKQLLVGGAGRRRVARGGKPSWRAQPPTITSSRGS